MADGRALVKNAADPEQVKHAQRQETRDEDRKQAALLETMRTPAGRIVLWHVLESAGVFESVWENSARIHYNAGRQDLGHEWMARLVKTRALEDLYLQMESEARAYARSRDRGAAAVQTARADQETHG